MFTRRQLTGLLLSLTTCTIGAYAQKTERKMDPEILNYKLNMDRIRAYDVLLHKIFKDPASKGDLSSKSEHETLDDTVRRIEKSPIFPLIKSGGFSAREFCILPMTLMSAGGAYMIKTQYHKDATNLATPENIAFYEKNKAEIEKLTQSWSQDPDRN